MEWSSIVLKSISCKDVKSLTLFQKPSIYAVAAITDGTDRSNRKQKQRTPVDKSGGENPEWDQHLLFDLDGQDLFLEFDLISLGNLLLLHGNKVIGKVRVPITDLAMDFTGVFRFVSYQIQTSDGKPNGVLSFCYRLNYREVKLPPPDPAVYFPAPRPVVDYYPPPNPAVYFPAPTQTTGYYPPPPDPAISYPAKTTAVDYYPPPNPEVYFPAPTQTTGYYPPPPDPAISFPGQTTAVDYYPTPPPPNPAVYFPAPTQTAGYYPPPPPYPAFCFPTNTPAVVGPPPPAHVAYFPPPAPVYGCPAPPDPYGYPPEGCVSCSYAYNWTGPRY